MTEEESILAELRAISNGASANSRFNSKRSIPPAATLQSGECECECECECEQAFLVDNPENSNFNQYWYSSATIQVITSAILEILNSSNTNTNANANANTTTTTNSTDIAASCPPSESTTTTIKRVAFLSTPSLYFALPDQYRQHCKLFDFDEGTWASDPGYIHYDYKKPEHFHFHLDHVDVDVDVDVDADADETLYRSFDMVVIDPPFITKGVWECYAKTAKFLLKCDPLGQSDECNGGAAGAGAGGTKVTTSASARASASARGIVLGTTVPENAQLMKELFDAEPTVFQPSIPNLVYQYNVYVNCHEDHHCTCTVLNKANPEIDNRD